MPLPKQETIELYNEAHSLREVAKRYKVHPSWVAYCLNRWGVDTSKPDLSRRNAIIKRAWRWGIKVDKIAARFNLSPAQVYNICTGVPRPQKQPGCPDCKISPYCFVKELNQKVCQKCYARWRRNSANALD